MWRITARGKKALHLLRPAGLIIEKNVILRRKYAQILKEMKLFSCQYSISVLQKEHQKFEKYKMYPINVCRSL